MTARRPPPPRGRRGSGGRRLSPNGVVWLGAAALFLLVGALLAGGYYTEYYVPPRRTALEVGDRDFKMSYVADRMRYFLLDRAAQGQSASPSDSPRQTVEQIEREELLRQLGPADGLEATDAEIDDTLRTRVAELTGLGTPPPTPSPSPAADPSATGEPAASPTPRPAATSVPTATPPPFADEASFEAALSELLDRTKLSRDELRDIVKAEVLLAKLRERLRGEVAPTRPQVQILTLLLPTQRDADAAVARLEAGQRFEDIQRELDPDAPPALAGDASGPRDDLQWLTREMLLSPFAEPVFATPAGEVTGILPSDRGFAIVKVVARDDDRALDETQTALYVDTLVDEWFTEQRAKVEVQSRLDADRIEWVIDEVLG